MNTDPAARTGFGARFAGRVADHPERMAVTVAHGGSDPEPRHLTFAELDRRARHRARDWQERLSLRPGARVLLALPSCPEFAEAYTACLLAGLIAVPVPVPGASAHASARVAAIVRDCGAELVLTQPGELDTISGWFATQGLDGVRCEAVQVCPDGTPDWTPPATGPDTPGVLQYSSGSTGTPKGVVLSHGNITANVEALREAIDIGPDDHLGGWIPMHHDMGLFTQLTAGLLLGIGCTLMPPADFVRRPVEWLRLLERYGITITAAPDFAFDLCTRLVTEEQLSGLDLSRTRVMLNGSEPIHAPTLAAFTERFASAGLGADVVSPGYGLAECTVFVSTKAPGALPTVITVDAAAAERGELLAQSGGRPVVGCGTPSGLDALVVDPATREELPSGRVGELWLRGPSVGQGYWNRPDASRETFAARPAADPGGDGWLRTGDLAALVGGEVLVVGRLKEMMVVSGRNLFPQDVEQEARQAHPALRGFYGAAFSVAAPEERVVLVHEVAPGTPDGELPAVAHAVQRRLAPLLGSPARNLLLVRRGSVRRTTSGKIQRSAMRASFLDGGVTALHVRLEPAVQRMLLERAETRPAAASTGGAA